MKEKANLFIEKNWIENKHLREKWCRTTITIIAPLLSKLNSINDISWTRNRKKQILKLFSTNKNKHHKKVSSYYPFGSVLLIFFCLFKKKKNLAAHLTLPLALCCSKITCTPQTHTTNHKLRHSHEMNPLSRLLHIATKFSFYNIFIINWLKINL